MSFFSDILHFKRKSFPVNSAKYLKTTISSMIAFENRKAG